MTQKTVLSVTLERLIGLVVFLLILGVLNLINFDSLINVQVVDFLNEHVAVIILFSVLFYLGEMFFLFTFPFNVPAPLINAVGSLFLVGFLFQIFYEIGRILSQDVFSTIKFLEPVAIVLVFLIVLIAGSVRIIAALLPQKKKEEKKKPSKNKKDTTSWEEVGNEFRSALYNLASSLKESLEPKKKKK